LHIHRISEKLNEGRLRLEKVRAYIIEDDEFSAQILSQILIAGGHSVAGVVSSGEEALETLAAADPDVIFMDISLAGKMDGIETARHLRDQMDIPIIFVTVSGDMDTLLRAQYGDPVGYIIKPYTERDIFVAITIAIHKHGVDRQLREARNFFSAVIDSLPAFVCVLDENGIVLTVNQAWREHGGVSPLGDIVLSEKDNFLDLHRALIDPLVPEIGRFSDSLAALLRNELTQFSIEYPCPTPMGQVWYHAKVTRYRGVGPLRLVVSHEDITQRRRAEKAQQESEEKFRSFFNKSSDGMILVDEKGILIEWNSSAEKLTGYRREDVLGKPYLDVHVSFIEEVKRRPEYIAWIAQELDQACKTGQAAFLNEYMEIPILRADGTITQFQQVTFAIPTETGYQIGSNTRDISHLKKMEQAEREQRLLAENLSSSAALINSTLKLDDVMDHILSSVDRVVPHEGADIMLIDLSTQSTRTSRAHCGHALPPMASMGNRLLPLADFPLLHKMAVERKAVVLADVRQYPGWIPDPAMALVRSYAAAPICAHGKVLGFINLFSTHPNFFTEIHAGWLQAFADQAATALENARLYAQVERLAEVDVLTGLLNRRGLLALAEREMDRAVRFHHPLTAMFMDIDQFKGFNDTYTHAVGDQVLKAVADCCLANIRRVDIVARFGGEEFIFLLPETDLIEGGQIADRLREAIASLRVGTLGGGLGVTVSIGVAQLGVQATSLDELINLADQAAHLAKDQGRNRVVSIPG
jgi:diguanylate cyclase (GGDEF)-like protein/PAS domain S-box-containing protein